VLARVHIDARWAPELLRALGDAHCLGLRRDDETVDVLVSDGTDRDQAKIELNFFLSAWALDHPRANLRVARVS
jgi:hypothetical protein